MKYIFFGTPEFGAVVLEKLIKAGYIPSAVICNPDEPIGRKQILTPPPVKRLIVSGKWPIEIFQPITKSELLAISHKLLAIKPDLAIVAAYGKILPKEIFSIPSYGFLNIHASLLPYYRGASPIQGAILNGDKETGVTIMKVDEKMDHGPILANSKLLVAGSDTYESLSKKLAEIGAELLIKTIPNYISGKIKPIKQNHLKATYTKIIKKEDGKIDWSKSADEIERMTRAFYPWPSAWTVWQQETRDKGQINKIVKILKAESASQNNFSKYNIGEIFSDCFTSIQRCIEVKCGKGILNIKELQIEGGKVLLAKEFLNGHKDFIGYNLTGSILEKKGARAEHRAGTV